MTITPHTIVMIVLVFGKSLGKRDIKQLTSSLIVVGLLSVSSNITCAYTARRILLMTVAHYLRALVPVGRGGKTADSYGGISSKRLLLCIM